MTSDVPTRKGWLRASILRQRESLDSTALAAAGTAIAGHALDEWRGTTTIAAYLSVGSEPPTGALLCGLVAGGVTVLVPIVDDDRLDWSEYVPGGRSTTGRFGIAEPAGPRLGPTALAAADLVVVPALAVDRTGNRLGRGGGFYDRALAGVTAPTVAVVYDAELLDEVPVAPHDRPVSGALRPAGLRWLSCG
jgi:5-formyltetrahydrofolate cyclo-ligase